MNKKINKCIDCGIETKGRGLRCYSCANLGNNNPSFKTGECSKLHYCIDCGKEISLSSFLKGNKRCQSCACKISSVNIKYKKILTKKFLIKEYIKNKKSMPQIAKEVGCSFTVIRNYLLKFNIKLRTHVELNKGKTNGNYTDGRTLKQHHCKDCGNKICYKTWKDGEGRCTACYRKFNKGTNHWNWQDGKSFEPYPLGWTKTFKEQIRYRDGYICQICGCPEIECNRKLDVHHIDYNKENLNPENLISLCKSCHMQTNYNRKPYIEYFRILKEAII